MKLYLPFFLCLLSLDLSAQTLKSFDIQTQVTSQPKGSYPSGFYNHRETLYFYAGEANNDNQFHKTDGTYHPIEYMLNPTYKKNSISIVTKPIMATIGNDLYFIGDDSIHGQEIWRYDGVKPYMTANLDSSNDGNPGSNYIDCLYSTGDNLIYTRRSRNILAYSIKTKTERTLPVLFQTSTPITAVNNTIFISSLMPNSIGFRNIELATYNLSTDSLTYYELTPGSGGTAITEYIADNKKVYFSGGSQLYLFDTENDPRPVQLTDANEFNNGKFYISDLLCTDHGNLYFTAINNNNLSYAYLYKYNPQNQTTTFVDSTHANIKQMVPYANKLFYVAVDSNYGEELFMIDEQGNVSIAADLDTGIGSGYPWSLTVANNSLFFSGYTPSIGRELFVYYDATATVKNTSFTATVTVYPNPTQDVAHIKMDLPTAQHLNITLTDVQGRTVYNIGLSEYYSGTNIVDIPTNDIPSGMYIYSIINDKGSTMMSGKLQKH